jgi:hypothetical protein
MPLENFAPDQWAQELTGPHYQEMMQAGWPAEVVEHSSNTLFNFLLFCGQLLMQEPHLEVPIHPSQDEQAEADPQIIPLSENLAVEVMDIFAQTLAYALINTMELGLPVEVRSRLIETLAEDAYSYAKQMVVSMQVTDPQPTREDLNQWVQQTAVEGVGHYLDKYEQEFGPVTTTPIPRQTQPQQDLTDNTQGADPYDDNDLAEAANSAEQPLPQASTAPSPQQSPPNASTHQGALGVKLAAIALWLKTMPSGMHDRLLQGFPKAHHATLQQLVNTDDWIAELDHQALTQQLTSLKQAFDQPVTIDETQRLTQWLHTVNWQQVQACLATERPIWLHLLTALKLGDPPEVEIPPPAMLKVLHQYLQQQLPQKGVA